MEVTRNEQVSRISIADINKSRVEAKFTINIVGNMFIVTRIIQSEIAPKRISEYWL